jgi:hypothetical protein
VGALINQTNLYFPRTASAIRLPDLDVLDHDVAAIVNAVSAHPRLTIAKIAWDLRQRADWLHIISEIAEENGLEADEAMVEKAAKRIFAPSAYLEESAGQPALPESDLLTFRRAEYNVLRQRVEDQGIPDLRVVPSRVPEVLADWMERLHLVERLRETRAFYGFDRLEPAQAPLAGMPESAMRQLFRQPPSSPGQRWLPATEVYGEGIYFELRNDAIGRWQQANQEWLAKRLDNAFVTRVADCYQTLAPSGADWVWCSRYLLVHTLSHVLIDRLVFECGYSAASLRERLYVSSDAASPMAGILIYTAAGDAEGTLGGLVRLGRADRFASVFRRAVMQASWCSSDPVCSEKLGGHGSRLANLAACHACALLPETACEAINHGLDRAMIVGTPECRERGAFSGLAEDAVSFEDLSSAASAEYGH